MLRGTEDSRPRSSVKDLSYRREELDLPRTTPGPAFASCRSGVDLLSGTAVPGGVALDSATGGVELVTDWHCVS